MLRTLAPPTCLTACVLLTACGGGHAQTETAKNATTAKELASSSIPVSSGAENPPSKAQAHAFARAVNLTASDLPGFKVSSESDHETSSEKHMGEELTRCAGGVGHRSQIAEVESKDFELEENIGARSVKSGVTVMRAPALAARELAAVRSERGQKCLASYITRTFVGKKHEGATVGPASVAVSSVSAPGTSGGFKLSVKMAVTVHSVRVPLYMNFIGFAYGPAEVVLSTLSLPEAFPAANEQRLFSLLLTRARAHHI